MIARRVRAAESGELSIDIQRLEIDREDALLSQLRSFARRDRDAARAGGRRGGGAGGAPHRAPRGRRDAAASCSPMTTVLLVGG